MENQFSELEIMILERELTRKSYSDIAFLLDRPLEEVITFVTDFLTGKEIIPYQLIIDQKRLSRPAIVRKLRVKKKKESKITSRIILQDQKARRGKNWEPAHKTKVIDYSKLVSVRIDDRTFVYAQPGEDPQKAREKYFANKNLPKSIAPSQRNQTVEVKKFKPI